LAPENATFFKNRQEDLTNWYGETFSMVWVALRHESCWK